jgi:hypothetical protein
MSAESCRDISADDLVRRRESQQQPIQSSRMILRTSSWFPAKKNSNAPDFSLNRRRTLKPARHSKILFLNRRIDIPAWECGLPKQSATMARASSAREKSASLKSPTQAWNRGLNRMAGLATLELPLERFQATGFAICVQFAVRFFSKSLQFRGSDAVFNQAVIFRIDLHRAERDNFAINHHADVLALQSFLQPAPKILPGSRHSQCLHTVILMSFKNLSKDVFLLSLEPE